jgi:hypothetical protein
MKVFERPSGQETLDRLPEAPDRIPELPDDVAVPDDISGLKLPVSVRPVRPATGIRWLRWLPVIALLALAAALFAVVVGDGGSDPTDVPSQEWVPSFDSPGGNSFSAHVLTPTDVVEAPAFGGPGGNSLFVPTIPSVDEDLTLVIEELPFGGPGGNSLRAP